MKYGSGDVTGEPFPACSAEEHRHTHKPMPAASVERAAQLFRAMGDGPRLRILDMLKNGGMCVTEIVEAMGGKFSTVSQRLRVLRSEGLILRRRQGNHIYYTLSDRHVAGLIDNALAHATELNAGPAHLSREGDEEMANTHQGHGHQHGKNCGHTGIEHDGHVDYLHDGHMHHQKGGNVEEHTLAVNSTNPASCTPAHACGEHEKCHKHGPKCGHEAVPHGDHTDYLVGGHLHHPHGDHCDDHGPVKKK
jgi:DNA-binding transcriptional ArsR family regulator